MPLPDDHERDIAVPGTIEVTPDELVAEAKSFAERGLRFVTATCIDHGATFELNYHFDNDLTLVTLRTYVARDDPAPSLSGAYLAAFLVENEMKELFGVNIVDIAIDYGGRLYLTDLSDPTPMVRLSGDAPAAQRGNEN